MEARNRFVMRQASSITVLLVLCVGVALAVFFATVQHNAQTVSTSPRQNVSSVAPHQQAPDAAERNDIYRQAIYREMLARFNDQSPDAQARNIQLSGQ
jgi:hypothetical protein